ncbi:conserved Plasmodium protein, unknown function [Plasmodium sp. gorilla clade G2]|uniref:conserved Plasmodium protein, unknown function n=1 Tax=Plasmodium sp. gorilla clade G2 TaxID=880535 RepID=UPI000D226254|nr:conserved Plasmodium protein, unknown function [Plasmodium sp. gorilla clade G2]SOV13075.1 conserved Plasmodium protein, unknown function [Plasmodium sp. gorilla clade G2]
MPEKLLKEENKKGDKDREIILLGLLNLDSLYGENWFHEKENIKKDIENKAVKLNQAFKYPSIFYEHFEFLSSDEYNYVKNNYIYSAILIYNPNINNKHNNEKKKNQGSKIKSCHNEVVDSNESQENTDTQDLNEQIKNEKNEKNEHVVDSKDEHVIDSKNDNVDHSSNEQVNLSKNNSKDCLNNDEKRVDGNHDKKKEGIGVLVVTCKKMEKIKMKHILIKMLKKEIKVESVVLKYKENIPHLPKSNNENKQKQTEIKYLDKQENISSPFILNNNFDVKRNNFFNMTAYIYGSSNILTNTSLIQREYCDDEWAEKLRKTKKEKQENNQSTDSFSNNILIRSFTSLFKK